jgi:hypothetical protein
VGGLLAVAAVAATVATPGVHTIPLPKVSASIDAGGNASAGPAANQDGGPRLFAIPAWIGWAEAVIAALVALLIIAFFVWHLLSNFWLSVREVARDTAGPSEAMSDRTEEVIAALDQGIAQLTSASDARAAVIACWVRLEEVAETAGTPRALSDAPADLVTRLLAAHRVSRAALTSLADLYRTARYSRAPVDEGMRSRAITALGQVRTEIAASRSGGLVERAYAASVAALRPGAPDRVDPSDRDDSSNPVDPSNPVDSSNPVDRWRT